MQKIPRRLSTSFPPMLLYLDDIEQIVEILHQASPDVEISTKDYALTDFKQLTELKQEWLTDVYIKIREPYISLDLEDYQGRLFAMKDDGLSSGLFEKIQKLLLARKRISADKIWLALPVVFVYIFMFLFLGGLRGTNSFVIISSLIGFGGTLLLVVRDKNRPHRHSIIIPKYRVQSPTFWKRNQDAILLAILSAIAGGIVTLIITKLLGVMP